MDRPGRHDHGGPQQLAPTTSAEHASGARHERRAPARPASVSRLSAGHSRDYGSNPYAGYDRVDSNPFLLDDWTLIDGRLNPKVRIVGVVIGEEEVAYPLPDLAEAGVVNDTVGGEPIVVLWVAGTVSGLAAPTVAGGDEVGTAVVFSRRGPDGMVLDFETSGSADLLDTTIGSTWTLNGVAIDGPMAGERLEPIPNDQPFWFAWAIFRPDTTIWQP